MLKPGMQTNFWNGDSLHGVNFQHSGNKISSKLGKMGWETVHSALDLFEKIGGWIHRQRGRDPHRSAIEDDPTGPDVYFRSGIKVSTDDFWSSIIWTSTARSEKVSITHEVGKPEISDFDVKVLESRSRFSGFEIAMNNFLKVTIFHPGNDLMKKVSGFIGREAFLGKNIIKELAAGYVLVHKADIRHSICWTGVLSDHGVIVTEMNATVDDYESYRENMYDIFTDRPIAHSALSYAVASRDIKAGEEITSNYIFYLSGLEAWIQQSEDLKSICSGKTPGFITQTESDSKGVE